MFFENENNNEPEELGLEAEFVRHTLSLFGCLYDNRAFPYIGNIDYEVSDDDDNLVDEEEEDCYDPHPEFESMICNFRTREVYKNELKARKSVIDEIIAKEEALKEKIDKSESDNIVIGDRLQAHTINGKTSESDINKKLKESIARSQRIRNKKREMYLTAKKNATLNAGRQGYKESKDLIAYIEKMKRAEEAQRHKFAEERKEEMMRRRERQIQQKELEIQKQEEARNTIEHISYRSNRKDTLDFHEREKERRKEFERMTLIRQKARKNANEQSKTLRSRTNIMHEPIFRV